MSNIKKTITAWRFSTSNCWTYVSGKKNMTACSDEVDALYFGIAHKLEIDFEFTTRRPREQSYHRFDYNLLNKCYQSTAETGGSHVVLNSVSQIIRRWMNGANTIYVAVWA